MSVMVEVYYRGPADPQREEGITLAASKLDGELSCREEEKGRGMICLTLTFPGWEEASAAYAKFSEQGEHVEGPAEYADD